MAESQWYLEVNGQKIGPFALDHIQGLYADGEIKGYHQVTSDQLEGQWISVQELVDSLAVAAPPPPGSLSTESSNFSAPPPPPANEDEEDDGISAENIPLPVLESADEISSPILSPILEVAEGSEPDMELSSPPPRPEAPAAVFNSEFQPPPRPPDLRSAVASAEVVKKSGAPASPPIKTLPPEPEKDVTPTNDPALSMMSSLQLFKERQEKTTDTYDPTLVIQSDMLGRGDRSSSPTMWIVAIVAGVLLGCISWGVLKALKNKTKAPSGSITEVSSHATPPPPVTRVAPPVTTNVPPPAANSIFHPAEGPREQQHRMAPPRPLVAPSSAPAPTRQFEPPRDQQPPQIDTAQPNEVPPQPQYAPQYQAYPPPNANSGDPSNPQQQVVPQQPYVDPNNPQAPPVYPAAGENFNNGAPGQPQNLPPQGAPLPQNAPGMDNFNNGAPQQVPQDQDQLLQQQQQLQNQQPPPGQPGYPQQ